MDEPTIVHALRANAEVHPDKPLFSWIDGDAQETESYTFAEAMSEVDSLAWLFTAVFGLSRGDRVVLVYPPSLDFSLAMLACFRSGIVPVATFPPQSESDIESLNNVCTESGMPFFLCVCAYECLCMFASAWCC